MRPAVAAAALLLVAGCAQVEAAQVIIKTVVPAVADKAVDAAYKATCWMPYPIEARFLGRHEIGREAIQAWCRRRDAR